MIYQWVILSEILYFCIIAPSYAETPASSSSRHFSSRHSHVHVLTAVPTKLVNKLPGLFQATFLRVNNAPSESKSIQRHFPSNVHLIPFTTSPPTKFPLVRHLPATRGPLKIRWNLSCLPLHRPSIFYVHFSSSILCPFTSCAPFIWDIKERVLFSPEKGFCGTHFTTPAAFPLSQGNKPLSSDFATYFRCLLRDWGNRMSRAPHSYRMCCVFFSFCNTNKFSIASSRCFRG